ncbi:hypothetical protein [Escherichia coli]|uniref:hypothetical protein n=1 Tax=Escherichia coli TaxID=562 RepID=UPI00131A50A4|nr:hypothetical protein [Escherichia coli]HAX3169174.1 hypothetical protein [Escherichia coli]
MPDFFGYSQYLGIKGISHLLGEGGNPEKNQKTPHRRQSASSHQLAIMQNPGTKRKTT